ncbi:hypothetical protein OROGR_012706 [Orobanche gracilis]
MGLVIFGVAAHTVLTDDLELCGHPGKVGARFSDLWHKYQASAIQARKSLQGDRAKDTEVRNIGGNNKDPWPPGRDDVIGRGVSLNCSPHPFPTRSSVAAPSGKAPERSHHNHTSVPPRCPAHTLVDLGVNRDGSGSKSYWDEEDSDYALNKVKPLLSSYDSERLKGKEDQLLLESAATECMRVLHLTSHFGERLSNLKQELSASQASNKKQLEEFNKLRDDSQAERRRLVAELEKERSTGETFCNSEAGRIWLCEEVAKAMEKLKGGDNCSHLVEHSDGGLLCSCGRVREDSS